MEDLHNVLLTWIVIESRERPFGNIIYTCGNNNFHFIDDGVHVFVLGLTQVIFLHPAPLHPHIYSNGHICLGNLAIDSSVIYVFVEM